MILTMFNVKPYRDFLFYILADPLDFVPSKTLIYFCLLMNLPSASTKIEKKTELLERFWSFTLSIWRFIFIYTYRFIGLLKLIF